MVPIPSNVPPQEPLYQYQSAPVPRLPPEKLNMLDTPLHITPGEAKTEPGAADNILTVIVSFEHMVVLHVPSALK